MGILSSGFGLAGDAASSIPGARGRTIRRMLLAAEVYAEGIEAGVGNAYEQDGRINDDFYRDVVRDVAAGAIGALVVEAAIVAGAGQILAAIGAAAVGAPFVVPAIAAAIIAGGLAWIIGNGVAALLDQVPPDWLPNLFGPNFFSRDPLVLDMDLGGVSLTSLSTSNVYFDLDGNGFTERTGWAAPREGLLALDVNRNGRIDNGGELFGTATQNGFEVLARYDDNRDGRIDAADSVWNSLLVWRDANRDGISDASELTAITANDVAGIDLTPNPLGPFEAHRPRAGNAILAVSDYTRTSGGTAEVVAVAFTSDQTNTRFVLPDSFEYDPDVFKLPNLRGYGELPDLWVAMTLDPELKAMVQDLMADVGNFDSILDLIGAPFSEKQPDYYQFGRLRTGETIYHYRAGPFENILARWAGVPINDGVFVRDYDEGQMLALAEKFLGRSFTDFNRRSGETIRNPNFHNALWQMTQNMATRFVVGWADIVQNGTALGQTFDCLGSLYLFAQELNAANDNEKRLKEAA